MPEVTQPALGKGIGGAMVGLALVTLLSLLWMALRRKPRFGRKTSAVLRSLYSTLLGLGGWFAGVLVVTTTLPSTPLDDEWLATLSIGLPVGLGIYFAWVSGRSRLAGFLFATAGGLVGAWLGFHPASTSSRSSPPSSERRPAQTSPSSSVTSRGLGRLRVLRRAE